MRPSNEITRHGKTTAMKPDLEMTPLLDWAAAANARAEAGGKGWQLGLMARYGLPVPDGFIVPAAACRQALYDSGLLAMIEEAEQANDVGSIIEACHADLQAWDMPLELDHAIADAIAGKAWENLPLVVRSSGTAEDSEQASFAGIHLTRLNVRGTAAVLQAVRDVWASLWTPQAVAYRTRFGISHAEAGMAVVVMPLLEAEAAGIAFSCDPRTGRDDRVVIHAQWGLGESLVAGEADGDEYLLQESPDDAHLVATESRTGSKLRRTIALEHGGTSSANVDPALAQGRVLTDIQALALGELVRDAAFALDMAQPFYDIEWVWDGRQFWLVQARPVTAIARNTYQAIADQPTIWSNGNTRDVVPLPLSAMDWWAVRRMVNIILEEGLRISGYPMLPGAQRTALRHGRLYLNLSLIMWEGWDGFGVTPAMINNMAGGHQPQIRVFAQTRRDKMSRALRIVRYVARMLPIRRRAERIAEDVRLLVDRWRKEALPGDPLDAYAMLLERIRQVHAQKELAFLQGSGGASLSMLVKKLDRWMPGRGYQLATALLAGGEPSVTARQGYALMDLAAVAASDAHVRAWLGDPARDNEFWRTLPETHPFQKQFTDFLARYGHRTIYESYWRQPRWREEPGYLLDSIAGLIEVSREALHLRQRKAASDAWAAVKANVPWQGRLGLQNMVRNANAESNQRELARSSFVLLTDGCRPLLFHLGEQLANMGALIDAKHVVELTVAEIGMALRGEVQASGIAARAGDRLAKRLMWETQPGPDVIQEGAPPIPLIDDAVRQSSPESSGDTRQGVAVGAGRARAVARVIHMPSDGARLGQGEILVAPSTDPAWTPLFLKAGGLVMETGGYLSHGAIVAREFAVPAVVNLPGVLDWIKDGDLVEVNGATGQVRRLPKEKP
jgi:rifampicin phosphotransferase